MRWCRSTSAAGSSPPIATYATRVPPPGGRIVIVDFVRHDKEWMRQELGVVWLGFEPEEIQSQLAAAGCDEIRLERRPSAPKGADLPETFIVDGKRS